MAFSDLEKRKHKSFPEKQHASARANGEQKPYEASVFSLPVYFRSRIKFINIKTENINSFCFELS